VTFQHCGDVFFNPVIANILARIGGSEQRGNSIVDPTRNQDLHEIRGFGGERFHDPRMQSAPHMR
jgi:hypothetical protein